MTQLVSPFAQAVSELPVNQVSDPVQTQFGYHLIEVMSRQVAPYDDSLKPSVSSQVFLDWLRKALQAATIKVDPQYGTVEKGNADNGEVPTIVPPTGPAFPTSDVADRGTAAVTTQLLERVGDAPLYVSVDIDVLDPAHAPGTGTPEAGGLTSRELLSMVRGLRPARIVGADVVEVSPAYDHSEITAVAAAHVLYELVTVMALGRA